MPEWREDEIENVSYQIAANPAKMSWKTGSYQSPKVKPIKVIEARRWGHGDARQVRMIDTGPLCGRARGKEASSGKIRIWTLHLSLFVLCAFLKFNIALTLVSLFCNSGQSDPLESWAVKSRWECWEAFLGEMRFTTGAHKSLPHLIFCLFDRLWLLLDVALVVMSINYCVCFFLPAYKSWDHSCHWRKCFIRTATLLDIYKAGKDSLVLSFNRCLVLTMWQAL